MWKRLLTIVLAVVAGLLRLSAQNTERTDSLVRLMSAQQMELVERNGSAYRKVTGPARFLHNNTYLICDTAYWHVDMQQIEAIGHVRILQEETVLTGDKLTYYIDRDLAEFRGTLVQLEDKDHNMLRTRHMDYNTRDSVAVFQNGGSMKDKDGQIIESRTGTYDSKIKLFTFTDDVNMFTDSIFVKTTRLTYDTGRNYATFSYGTNAWKEDDMLSSDAGWYDRNRELFFFRDKVHGLTQEQEVWADSLFFWRNTSDVEMAGHAQLTDTTRNVFALAGHMYYVDSLARITLTRDPAVVGVSGDGGAPADTVWFGADRMVYQTYPMCDIPEGTVQAAQKRLDDLAQDAIMAYRRKAAEEAERARQEAMKDDPNNAENAARRRGAAGNAGADAAKAGEEPGLPEPGGGASRGGAAEPPGTPAAAEMQGAAGGIGESPAAAGSEGQPEGQAGELPERRSGGQPEEQTGDGQGADNPDAPLITVGGMEVPSDSLRRPLQGALGASDSLRSGLPDSLGVVPPADSLMLPPSDSLMLPPADSLLNGADSLGLAPSDSLALGPVDSTKVGFLTAVGHARLFREDVQLIADSLAYNDLDSLVRLYKDPIVWNEVRRQYSSDSLYAVIKDRRMQKASLMSNAFIIIEEEPDRCYDQIRSVEMLAYFDSTGGLYRFDAMGDANAIFYLKEDSTFATINLSQAKMLYAQFRNGEIDRVSYFDQIKNNAYPLAQLSRDERTLKGFNWQPDRRPTCREEITPLTLRASQRAMYEARPRAKFVQTDIYYPGYMSDVYKRLREMEAAKARRRQEQAERERMQQDSVARAGELGLSSDSLGVSDSLGIAFSDSLALADSLSRSDSLFHAPDSLAVSDSLNTGGADSLATVPVTDPKALKKAEREAAAQAKAEARQRRLEEKERRWAQLDSLDAAKAQLKADKKAEKLRKKKLKALQAAERQAEKDRKKLEKYLHLYEKKKAREEERQRRRNKGATLPGSGDDGGATPGDPALRPAAAPPGEPVRNPVTAPPGEAGEGLDPKQT